MSTPRYPDPHQLHQDGAQQPAGEPGRARVPEPADAPSPAPAPRGRRTSTLLSTAMLAVLLALGLVVNTATAEDNPHPGAAVAFDVGEDVTLQNFRVHVNGARLARAILADDQHLETRGLWLIVDLSYANVRRPAILNDLGVRDSRGRTYTISDRYTWGTWMAAPDTWFRGEVAFEVPASSVADGAVQLFVWPGGRAQAQNVPMRYGTTHLSVDPGDVADQPVQIARAELLPAGQR